MENMQKWIVRIIATVVFGFCIALIVTGQKTVGFPYLVRMLIGLFGLLLLLYFYNKKNQ
ncbi:DUF6903 family protein [Velocimicrobium porci]|uniref:DUF6903 family protein n=1 Tax=Velocimicrobium porci TaxID=2606634 RepID=UPI0012B37E82|nr:hypothetical protein [Velocimicrobium porci]